ncbi:MAG: efflux transporter outer membrane subunit [Deltaproteobacteria bacterium]|nr:MAG: efflux transporter outer membrane subunit [Deltaproteobacteria bacterium]
MKRVSALIMILLVTGCSLHQPTDVSLSVDPPQEFLGQPMTGEARSLSGRWWLAFEDQQLNQLMTELFEQNLELTQAVARLEQVEALAQISRSAESPFLTGGGSVGRSSQPGLADDFIGNNQQLSLAAGYELDLWGKLSAQSTAAELELSASRQDIQTLYLGLSARLADLYFLAIEQRAQLALTDQSIASFAETLSRVENRYNLGLVPAVDMYQARQSLAGAQAARYLFEASLAEVEHAIAVLIGHYPEPGPGGSLEQLPGAPDLFAAGIPADLISQRPDLQAALRRVEAADYRVAAAIADRFPSISFSGGYGSLRQDVTAGLIKGEFWSLLGNLAMPIVDGGRRRAEVDRKEAALREAVANYQQKVLTAFQEVEDALVNNSATEQRVERLAETAQATGATLRLSTDRYLAGLVDYLPVLTAQRTDFDVSSRLLAARRQLLAERISLARALGGDWMNDQMISRLQIEEDKKK